MSAEKVIAKKKMLQADRSTLVARNWQPCL